MAAQCRMKGEGRGRKSTYVKLQQLVQIVSTASMLPRDPNNQQRSSAVTASPNAPTNILTILLCCSTLRTSRLRTTDNKQRIGDEKREG